jgi:hypothetical protein
LLLGLAAAGCGGSSSNSKSATSAAQSTQPANSVQTAARPQGAAPKSRGAGYGATEAAWAATHTPDNDFPSGSAYDSDSSLPEVEGHPAARYTGVHRQGGQIVEYAYHFPSAPIASATHAILSSQLPADAHQVWFTVKSTCALMLVRSKTVQRQLTGAVGQGKATRIHLNSGTEENSYDPAAVTVAVLAPAATTETPAQAEC